MLDYRISKTPCSLENENPQKLFGLFRSIYDKVLHGSHVLKRRLSSLKEEAVSPLAPIFQFMRPAHLSRCHLAVPTPLSIPPSLRHAGRVRGGAARLGEQQGLGSRGGDVCLHFTSCHKYVNERAPQRLSPTWRLRGLCRENHGGVSGRFGTAGSSHKQRKAFIYKWKGPRGW